MERILVVDDERAHAPRRHAKCWSASGFAVTAVESGAAALAALADGGFALVISDMRMPGDDRRRAAGRGAGAPSRAADGDDDRVRHGRGRGRRR